MRGTFNMGLSCVVRCMRQAALSPRLPIDTLTAQETQRTSGNDRVTRYRHSPFATMFLHVRGVYDTKQVVRRCSRERSDPSFSILQGRRRADGGKVRGQPGSISSAAGNSHWLSLALARSLRHRTAGRKRPLEPDRRTYTYKHSAIPKLFLRRSFLSVISRNQRAPEGPRQRDAPAAQAPRLLPPSISLWCKDKGRLGGRRRISYLRIYAASDRAHPADDASSPLSPRSEL
ncbi:hypothetical protein C8Q74DRAFT_1023024 [Fomes fomentarius]|nr:hypothetical protein C8Q74DRAFT_1023024 [Fomes fomentarius]